MMAKSSRPRPRRSVRATLFAVALAACGKGESAPTGYHFDGHPLGSPIAALPYTSTCRTATPGLLVLAGRDCDRRPGSAFPDGTSLAIVGDTTVDAIAWFGGTYFTAHSDFPLAVGVDATAVAPRLGPTEASFDVVQGFTHVHVRRHHDRVVSFVDRGIVVGYAVGALPDDPHAPLWRTLLALYIDRTPVPAALDAISTNHDVCQFALLKVYPLVHPEMGGRVRDPALARAFGDDIDDCSFNRTRPYLDCLAGATTALDVRGCMADPSW